MIDRFVQVSSSVFGVDDPDVLLDTLWLARKLGPRDYTIAPADSDDASTADMPADAAREQPAEQKHLSETPITAASKGSNDDLETGSLFLSGEDCAESPAPIPTTPVRIPKGSALPQELELVRAFRMLPRRWLSRTEFELDEDATVEATTLSSEGFVIIVPVLRPVTERWLNAAIVMEHGPSSAIWSDTMDELQRLLQYTGVFGDVRTFALHTDTGQLVRQSGVASGIGVLKDPHARRLVLFFSAGISDAWIDGSVGHMLAVWGETTPVVLVHALPERLWINTALGEPDILVKGIEAGSANSSLRFVKEWWTDPHAEPDTDRLSLPVLTLDPGFITRWAEMFAARRGRSSPAFRVPCAARKGFAKQIAIEESGVEERVAAFRTNASPDAFRLASRLAAAPFSVALLQLVQASVLGSAARQAHIAEIMFSGLVESLSTDDSRLFRFEPRAASILLESLREDDARALASSLQSYIGHEFGTPYDFSVLAYDPKGIERVPASIRPFAQLGFALLERVGMLSPRGTGAAHTMRRDRRRDPFHDDEWEIVAREGELREALNFLRPPARAASRRLRIKGAEGVGKSFFTRELVVRFAVLYPWAICLYIECSGDELDSSELESELGAVAALAAKPTRGNPQNVPFRSLPGWFVSDSPMLRGRSWAWLVEASQHRPVLLALDNAELLSESIMADVERSLDSPQADIRIVTIERDTSSAAAALRLPHYADPHALTIELRPFSPKKVLALVRTIAGKSANTAELADAVYARSNGNARILAFTLRDAARRIGAGGSAEWEVALQTLSPTMLMIVRVVFLLENVIPEHLIQIAHTLTGLGPEELGKALDMLGWRQLVIFGAAEGDVRIAHDMVRDGVRATMRKREMLNLRGRLIDALSALLRQRPNDFEYDELAHKLHHLVSRREIRTDAVMRMRFVKLVNFDRVRERFDRLLSLYQLAAGALRQLPMQTLTAFLDAFGKTAQFDAGLAAIEQMRAARKSPRTLRLFEAKYLLARGRVPEAGLLQSITPGSDRDAVDLALALIAGDADQARSMIERLPAGDLNADQCGMLRNAAHLYDFETEQKLLRQAQLTFHRHGSRFGEATTLNNLAALELWYGRYELAGNYLTTARNRLARLSANDVALPIANLAVLHIINGDAGEGARILDQARRLVSDELIELRIALRFNAHVAALITGNAEPLGTLQLLFDLEERCRVFNVRTELRDVVTAFAAELARPAASERATRYNTPLPLDPLSREYILFDIPSTFTGTLHAVLMLSYYRRF